MVVIYFMQSGDPPAARHLFVVRQSEKFGVIDRDGKSVLHATFPLLYLIPAAGEDGHREQPISVWGAYLHWNDMPTVDGYPETAWILVPTEIERWRYRTRWPFFHKATEAVWAMYDSQGNMWYTSTDLREIAARFNLPRLADGEILQTDRWGIDGERFWFTGLHNAKIEERFDQQSAMANLAEFSIDLTLKAGEQLPAGFRISEIGVGGQVCVVTDDAGSTGLITGDGRWLRRPQADRIYSTSAWIEDGALTSYACWDPVGAWAIYDANDDLIRVVTSDRAPRFLSPDLILLQEDKNRYDKLADVGIHVTWAGPYPWNDMRLYVGQEETPMLEGGYLILLAAPGIYMVDGPGGVGYLNADGTWLWPMQR